MRVLLTGGAGFIGSHTCEQLLAAGHAVRVFDNFSTGKRDNLPNSAQLEIVTGDVRDHYAVNKAMHGVDVCLHLAAQVSVARSIAAPVESAQHNILGLLNVLDAARASGVRRVVYASSAAVYGQPAQLPLQESAPTQPLSPYGLEKQVDEQYAHLFADLYGVATLGLRYFNVFGPRQDPRSPYSGVISKFLDAFTRGDAPQIFGDGEQTRDFVYVKDVARANCAAVDSAFQGVVNVATGTRTSLLDLLGDMRAVFGSGRKPKFATARAGDIRDSCGDPALMHETLGVQARWTIPDGLRELVPGKSAAA